MLQKWLLAAAFVGGLTTLAPAAARAQYYERPKVQIELSGRLEVLRTPISVDDDKAACLPPPFEYAIEIDGQRFHLQMADSLAKGDELDGRWVIVNGELEGDTVRVQALREAKDDVPLPYARVSVPGQLVLVQRVASDDWELRVEEKVFPLEFANEKVHAQAEKILAEDHGDARVEGTLKNGRIVVTTIEAYLVRY